MLRDRSISQNKIDQFISMFEKVYKRFNDKMLLDVLAYSFSPEKEYDDTGLCEYSRLPQDWFWEGADDVFGMDQYPKMFAKAENDLLFDSISKNISCEEIDINSLLKDKLPHFSQKYNYILLTNIDFYVDALALPNGPIFKIDQIVEWNSGCYRSGNAYNNDNCLISQENNIYIKIVCIQTGEVLPMSSV